MRVYKQIFKWSILLATVTCGLSIGIYYVVPNHGGELWVNILLAIFGSAVLSALTGLLSYLYERRKTMESFVYHTRQILSYLNKYQTSMTLDEKIKFFIGYCEFDKSAWDADYGNMDFFFEKRNKNREYIFNNIYQPILQFSNAVSNHLWHFRWYLDGSGRNEKVMTNFIGELEAYLISHSEVDVPTEYNENGDAISFCKISSTEPKLVLDIKKELNGHYYDIMYNTKQDNKPQEDTNNG